eukprot:evm.model.scf_393EXC.1 EVM.evm.TU.scf_393EXC.1   scf_393EXC:5447-9277(-)
MAIAGEDSSHMNDPVNDFKETIFGLAVLYFDAVLVNSEWAMHAGFGVGLVIGMNSLISVLAQYKSLSLTLTEGVIDDVARPGGSKNYRERQRQAMERLQKLQLQYTKLSELIKEYPLNSTVLFFGILLSTAVLQLVVTGATATLLISTFAALPEAFNLLQPVLTFIIAWFVIAVVDSLILQEWMIERVLTENYRLKHPNVWILYTLVYTMLNLVLGILYAVWRLFLLVVLSLSRFNRLDRSLFPSWQSLDQGHNAFFSMVLMHYTIQRNSSYSRESIYRRRMEEIKLRMGRTSVAGSSLGQRPSLEQRPSRSLPSQASAGGNSAGGARQPSGALSSHTHSSLPTLPERVHLLEDGLEDCEDCVQTYQEEAHAQPRHVQ